MSKRVLVIGESCIDTFIYGESNRMSPEADAPVFISKYKTVSDGMAANVNNNLVGMGIVTTLITNSEIISKTRFIDWKTNKLYMRHDQNDHVDRYDIINLPALLPYDAVVISDYCKGFLDEEDIEYIADHCITILDTKKPLGDWCRNVHLIKVNRIEAAYNKTYINNNSDRVVITLDKDGAEYNGLHFPTKSISNADVSGAGDTFLAAITASLLNGESFTESIRYAVCCATEVVKYKGITVFNPSLSNNNRV